jgi:hypothetical protein
MVDHQGNEIVADFMTKPLQGSHFRRLRDLIMGTTSIKKAKVPSKSTVTVTKRDGRIKVRALERRQTAVRPVSPTSVVFGTVNAPQECVGVI